MNGARTAVVGMAAVVVAVVVAVLVGAGPAGACSIAGPLPTEQTLLDQADLVFEGVAQASQDPNTTATIITSGDPITWTFSVAQVVKGSATATQQVTTARSGASCGFTFVVGHRYRVYARASTTGFTTDLLSGTREITDLTTTTTTGPPPTTPAPTTHAPTPAPPTAVAGRHPLARTGTPIAPVAAVGAGLLVLGWLLARARSRPVP